MIEMFPIHVDDIVLLNLAGYLAQVFGLLPVPRECRLHQEVLEQALECSGLLVVVALVDAGDAQLLILPDHLLVLLLIGRHVYQLLLDLGQDLDADARGAHLLKVTQDV